MTKRDILMRLVAFAACAGAFAKTPGGAGIIVVRIAERHSDICLVRSGVELAREHIPIGRANFVNDVAVGLAEFIRDTLESVGTGGTPVLLADGGGIQGLAHVM
jgi:hypothetical protein